MNLYRGRRAVSLQTFTTRHSNRKLQIVHSYGFVNHFYAMRQETTKFGKKNNAK